MKLAKGIVVSNLFDGYADPDILAESSLYLQQIYFCKDRESVVVLFRCEPCLSVNALKDMNRNLSRCSPGCSELLKVFSVPCILEGFFSVFSISWGTPLSFILGPDSSSRRQLCCGGRGRGSYSSKNQPHSRLGPGSS
ncbi:hypothetical protein VNO77_44392 [Canavalia gladiata]|uniref:Uncharacterized protein n=1 Tax=Canavalia gladiata TaxID=3824 RepID=A0AAN9JYG0_CANGL